MSRIKLLMDVKEDAESLLSSIGVLLRALESDGEVKATEEVKTYELEQVRKILADKSRAGFTDQIRELLGKYGAKKLSEINPKSYAALVSNVENL